MTREDVLALDVGDSVIGLLPARRDSSASAALRNAELPVVETSEVYFSPEGQVMRAVRVELPRLKFMLCMVREGDKTTLGARR